MIKAFRWFFTNRKTGAITVAQAPNLALWIAIGTGALGWATHPTGRWSTALTVVSKGSLSLWAADELLRGVNPWRRCLGVGVLIGGVLTAL